MKEKKLDRRAFLRKIGGLLFISAGALLAGTVPRLRGVKSLKGYPARHYRKLAG